MHGVPRMSLRTPGLLSAIAALSLVLSSSCRGVPVVSFSDGLAEGSPDRSSGLDASGSRGDEAADEGLPPEPDAAPPPDPGCPQAVPPFASACCGAVPCAGNDCAGGCATCEARCHDKEVCCANVGSVVCKPINPGFKCKD